MRVRAIPEPLLPNKLDQAFWKNTLLSSTGVYLSGPVDFFAVLGVGIVVLRRRRTQDDVGHTFVNVLAVTTTILVDETAQFGSSRNCQEINIRERYRIRKDRAKKFEDTHHCFHP